MTRADVTIYFKGERVLLTFTTELRVMELIDGIDAFNALTRS
jgi:hypothetical protein